MPVVALLAADPDRARACLAGQRAAQTARLRALTAAEVRCCCGVTDVQELRTA